jgi:sporadic carbohydrate cluster protein (TIGR04323 family)
MLSGNRRGYRAYVTPRPFGNYNIPVPLQSLALRDYCQNNNMLFVLPANENIFPRSYMVLEGLIQDLSDYEGILMCSMHMLPKRAERRRQIYTRILEQGCSLHFVFERLTVDGPQAVERIEELLQIDRIVPHLSRRPVAH